MMLPSRVDKATGLAAALEELGLSRTTSSRSATPRTTTACSRCPVRRRGGQRPARAQGARRPGHVGRERRGRGRAHRPPGRDGSRGGGAAARAPRHPARHRRARRGGAPARAWATVLVVGAPAAATSAVAAGLVERIAAWATRGHRVADRATTRSITARSSSATRPHAPATEVAAALDHPLQNAVLRLNAVAAADRPRRFESLLSQLLEMRARTGRPHWIVIDEADQLCAAASFGAARRPRGPDRPDPRRRRAARRRAGGAGRRRRRGLRRRRAGRDAASIRRRRRRAAPRRRCRPMSARATQSPGGAAAAIRRSGCATSAHRHAGEMRRPARRAQAISRRSPSGSEERRRVGGNNLR